MAAAKRANLIAFSRMNAPLINLTSALDFLVYVRGQGLNVLYLLRRVVVVLYLCVQMVFAALNARVAKITSN